MARAVHYCHARNRSAMADALVGLLCQMPERFSAADLALLPAKAWEPLTNALGKDVASDETRALVIERMRVLETRGQS